MNNHKDLEILIAQGIVVLRKERRMRPQRKDIYYYVQDFQENNMLDYDLFCNVFDNMIEEGHIYNKYKDSDQKKESYYNNNITLAINNNISQSQDMRMPASHINTSLVTPSSEALNNSSSHSSSRSINVKDLYILIETKVKESIEPFVNKLASLLNDYESLITEKQDIEQLNIRMKYELKDLETARAVNEQLNKENEFLKNELKNKNEVIKLIINERKAIEDTPLQTANPNNNYDVDRRFVTNNVETHKKNSNVVR